MKKKYLQQKIIFLYLNKLNFMKNIISLSIVCMILSSCSNIKSDAEKACDFTTQIMDMMPQMMQLSMKAGFGDEESKKASQKELDEIQASLEKMSMELEKINEKYDEEEFQSYLLKNCESAKKMYEMSKAIQEIETVEEIEE